LSKGRKPWDAKSATSKPAGAKESFSRTLFSPFEDALKHSVIPTAAGPFAKQGTISIIDSAPAQPQVMEVSGTGC
jgi:hypothetical protein